MIYNIIFQINKLQIKKRKLIITYEAISKQERLTGFIKFAFLKLSV